jgi:hypothetical protein
MTAKKLAANWDLAVASGALVLIVGGLLAPRIRQLLDVGEQRDLELVLGQAAVHARGIARTAPMQPQA